MLAILVAQAAFRHWPTSEYRAESLSGFRVMISPEAVRDESRMSKLLPALKDNLATIGRLVPPTAYRKLQTVRFWIEQNNPENPGMTFHPSADWLKEHGYNVDKAGGVEIGNPQNFFGWRSVQPFMELHELSHAWEFRFMDRDSLAALRAAYGEIRRNGTYNWVLYANGKRRRAYALNNQHEYFAEMSEAYFGRNDFYPFDRADLKRHDPQGYAVVERAWGIGRTDTR